VARRHLPPVARVRIIEVDDSEPIQRVKIEWPDEPEPERQPTLREQMILAIVRPAIHATYPLASPSPTCTGSSPTQKHGKPNASDARSIRPTHHRLIATPLPAHCAAPH
jgi:hypothetical protein